MAFKKVEQAPLIKWEKKGQKVEGIYVGGRKVTTEFGTNTVHTIKTKKGAIAFFGTGMLNRLIEENVVKGNMIQIVLAGFEKNEDPDKNDLKVFEVSVDADYTDDLPF